MQINRLENSKLFKVQQREVVPDNKPLVASFVLSFPDQPIPNQLRWNERVITLLNRLENKIDQLIPNLLVRSGKEAILIPALTDFKVFREFNAWLKDNGHGDWIHQLATFVAKLPLKVANNLIRMLYDIVRIAVNLPVYAMVHPLKSPVQIAKLIVALVHALTQPDTWSKIGGGMMGSCIGHALLTGNPLSVLAVGIAAAMVVGGISLGTLKAALLAEKGMFLSQGIHQFVSQTGDLAEDFLTGFSMILLLEGIQQTIRGFQKLGRSISHHVKVSSMRDNWAREQCLDFIKKNELPSSYRFWRQGGFFKVTWAKVKLMGVELKDLSSQSAQFIREKVVVGTHPVYSYASDGEWIVTLIYETQLGYKVPFIDGILPPLPSINTIRLNDQVVPYFGAGLGVSPSLSQTQLSTNKIIPKKTKALPRRVHRQRIHA